MNDSKYKNTPKTKSNLKYIPRNLIQHRYLLALLTLIRIFTENFSTNKIDPVSQIQLSVNY